MSTARLLSIALILIVSACIDRLEYSVGLPKDLPISVSGFISNQPGPYTVYLNSSFDIGSKVNLKNPVLAKHVNLLDELGNDEELVEVQSGVYQTSSTQGRIGGVYTLRLEFLDGSVYESIPDTILMPGKIDSLYHEFTTVQDNSGATSYGFNVLANARGNSQNDIRYIWKMIGTFKAITHPELFSTVHPNGCYPIPEEFNKCNYMPLCTGLRNTAPRNIIPRNPIDFKRVGPCECCTCWYQIFNNTPILSDAIYNTKINYSALPIYRIPLSEWIFMFKIHTEVTQTTLTLNSFQFFKSIKDQRDAVGSLFQPITGKIPNSFKQISGTPKPINGIFFAGGMTSKSMYIAPEDVPNQVPVPIVDFAPRGAAPGLGWISCLELFPNATNTKPDFWVE